MTREWTPPNVLLAAALAGGTATALAGFWVQMLLRVFGATGEMTVYATIICTFAGPLAAACLYNWLAQRATRNGKAQAVESAAETICRTANPARSVDGSLR
jgi:hypothetical protein